MDCCEIESAVLFLHGRRQLTWLAPGKEARLAQDCASEITADCRRSSAKADEARNEWSCHRSPCETWGGIVEAAEEVQAKGDDTGIRGGGAGISDTSIRNSIVPALSAGYQTSCVLAMKWS